MVRQYLFPLVYFLVCLSILPGCNNDEEEEESEVGIDDVEIFRVKANGSPVEFLDMNNFSAYPFFGDSVVTDDSLEIYSLGGYIEHWDDFRLGGFTMGTIQYIDGLSTKQEFLDLFSIGSHPYTELGGQGVVVYYYTADGTEYRSDWGSGNQSGSSFTILEVKDDVWLGDPAMRVLAEFDCNVYSESGDQIQLTDGVCLFEVITLYLD